MCSELSIIFTTWQITEISVFRGKKNLGSKNNAETHFDGEGMKAQRILGKLTSLVLGTQTCLRYKTYKIWDNIRTYLGLLIESYLVRLAWLMIKWLFGVISGHFSEMCVKWYGPWGVGEGAGGAGRSQVFSIEWKLAATISQHSRDCQSPSQKSSKLAWDLSSANLCYVRTVRTPN